MMMMMMSHCRL